MDNFTSSRYVKYEELVANYNAALVDNLRGFGVDKAVSELWVPSEELDASVRDLLVSAKNAVEDTVHLSFSSKTMNEKNLSLLNDMLSTNFPAYDLRKYEDRFYLRVSDINSGVAPLDKEKKLVDFAIKGERLSSSDCLEKKSKFKQPDKIGEVYHKKLDDLSSVRSRDIKHGWGKCVDCSFELDGLTATVQIAQTNGLIVSVEFAGARETITQKLVKILSAIIVGLPVVEASEHGVVRLENYLRNDLETSVDRNSGIVLPEVKDSAFSFFGELLRGLLREYNGLVKKNFKHSFYDDPVADFWRDRSETEKVKSLQVALENSGFSIHKIEVISVENEARVIVDVPKPTGGLLMAIEKMFKNNFDERLEVMLAEIKDKNKLRASRPLQIGGKR